MPQIAPHRKMNHFHNGDKKTVVFYDDFLGGLIEPHWTLAAATGAIALVAGANGYVAIDPNAAVCDMSIRLNNRIIPVPTSGFIFEIRCRIRDLGAVTHLGIQVPAGTSEAYFSIDAAGLVAINTQNAGSGAIQDVTAITIIANTWNTFRIEVLAGETIPRFYVNNAEVGDGVPAMVIPNAAMDVVIHHVTSGDTLEVLDVDYVLISFPRN
jgi:hypothetical protein